jgi:hypothetical protein
MEIIEIADCMPNEGVRIFERLKQYTDKLALIPTVTLDNTPYLMGDILEGYTRIQSMLIEATYRTTMATKERDGAEAIATLEKFPEYCAAKNIKGTVDQCNKFLCMDNDVLMARDNLAKAIALESYLNTQSKTFYIAIDNLKKAQYGRPRISGEFSMNQMA